MKKIININTLLAVIVIIGVFLRFFQISSNPPSLTWDEAAWGYNAYTLGSTGHDEFGKFLPITYLESFGDYKPPVYAYLTVIPVKIFGLNEFSTRFASALFGVLTVLLSFFLVRQLLYEASENVKNSIGLITAFLLSISPWHILLSRAAFEQNVATFFVGFGVYLFLVSIHKYKWMLLPSVLSFLISMNTFNTARIIAPILLVALLLWNIKHLYKNMKLQVITAGIVGLILFIPLFLFLLTPQAKLRFQEVNIFSNPQIVLTSNQEIKNDGNVWWSKIIHNRRLGYTEEFLHHYFDNLSPDFLFIKGDGNPKFSTQMTGEMYIWEIPFLVAGVLFLFRKKIGRYFWFPVFWVLIGIIPAATARETPHALRIENILPMPQLFVAFGIYYLYKLMNAKIRRLYIKRTIIALFALAVVVNFFYFYHYYFTFYAKDYSSQWQYGYKQAIKYSHQVSAKYNNIVFTEKLGRPYIYVLFYEKYPQQKFMQTAGVTRDPFGFVTVNSFDKYVFLTTASSGVLKYKNSLFIDAPGDLPKNAKIVKTFYDLSGTPSLVAYTM
jgi:4-amino-4-deoxy-L-arabinose transferase-like glycosyltransferase